MASAFACLWRFDLPHTDPKWAAKPNPKPWGRSQTGSSWFRLRVTSNLVSTHLTSLSGLLVVGMTHHEQARQPAYSEYLIGISMVTTLTQGVITSTVAKLEIFSGLALRD